MAKRKIRLTRDYNNWFQLAGELYASEFGGDVVQAQRMAFLLRQANPGVKRFYRGTVIKLPGVPTGGPVITHEQMARARGENMSTYYKNLNTALNRGTSSTQPSPSTTSQQQTGQQTTGTEPPALFATPWQNTSARLPDLDIYSFFYGPQFSNTGLYRPPETYNNEVSGAHYRTFSGQYGTPSPAQRAPNAQDIYHRRIFSGQFGTPPAATEQPLPKPSTYTGGAVGSYFRNKYGIPEADYVSPEAAAVTYTGGAIGDYLRQKYGVGTESSITGRSEAPEPAYYTESVIPLIGRARPGDYRWLSDWAAEQGYTDLATMMQKNLQDLTPKEKEVFTEQLDAMLAKVDNVTGYVMRMIGLAEVEPESESPTASVPGGYANEPLYGGGGGGGRRRGSGTRGGYYPTRGSYAMSNNQQQQRIGIYPVGEGNNRYMYNQPEQNYLGRLGLLSWRGV